MAASDSQLTFPHAELSPIVGEPTNTSLQLLRRQTLKSPISNCNHAIESIDSNQN